MPTTIERPVDPHLTRTDLTGLLQGLTAAWRSVRGQLGLPAGASFADVARVLQVDRGTAQRLNRLGRLNDVGPADLEHFPGVRAWHRVRAGAALVLGGEDPAVTGLVRASDAFGEYLAAAGGSRSAVVRHLKADAGGNPRGGAAAPAPAGDRGGDRTAVSPVGADSAVARAAWVQASADVVGYCADVRLDVQLVRDTAAADDAPPGAPRQLHLAMLNVLHGCRGRPGAMPLAFIRQARAPAFARDAAAAAATPAVPRPFRLLRAGTSRPAPAVLTTGDAVQHTIFVEPQWVTAGQPLDLALLQADPDPIPSPWGTALEWLEFACVNRHPCRQLVLDRFVSREKDAVVVPSLAAFRSHNHLSHDEPWFDRLPQAGTVRRLGTPAEASAAEPFPGYTAVLTEALAHLNWDPDELIVYRATIENPIPLATYTVMFDRASA